MKKYLAYVPWETHRFLRPRNLVILAVLLAVLLVIVNLGVTKYLALEEKVAKFKVLQEKQFKRTPDYTLYSIFGIQLMYIPAPASILYDYTIVPPDLTAKVNSLNMMEISSNLKGKFMARGFFIGAVNFAFILLTIFSLLDLLYGLETFHTHAYQKFLLGGRQNWKVLLTISTIRFLLFSAGIIAISGLTLLYIRLRGVVFTLADYKGFLAFLLTAEVVFLFFFILGLLFSFIRSLKMSLSFLFGSWIVFTIIIPAFLLLWVEDRFPDAIKDLEASLKKLEIQLQFEQHAEDKYGKFNKKNAEENRLIIEDYWKVYFPRMVAEEKGLLEELEKSADEMERVYLLTPGTFYLMTWSEVSSTGYRSFFEFYRLVLEMMTKFSRFWIDQVFYKDVHKMVNFIQGNENLFGSQSRTPRYYWWGLGFHLVISLVLAFVTYFRFLRFFYRKPKKAKEYDEIEIDFKPENSYGIACPYPEFLEQFVNTLFGKAMGLKWKITLNGKEITGMGGRGIIYLPDPNHLPEEIKGIHLLNLIKRLYPVPKAEVERVKEFFGEKVLNTYFKKLDLEVKVQILVMITALAQASIYIIYDLTAELIPEIPKEKDNEENRGKNQEDLQGSRKSLNGKEDREYFDIQGTLRGRDVILIDISQRRYATAPANMIGIVYEDGKYVKRDYGKIIRWAGKKI